YLLARKRKIDECFYLSQLMIGSHPFLQVHRVIKELRLALRLSHHDGNTALTDQRKPGYYFLLKTSDLGNTPFRCDPISPSRIDYAFQFADTLGMGSAAERSAVSKNPGQPGAEDD